MKTFLFLLKSLFFSRILKKDILSLRDRKIPKKSKKKAAKAVAGQIKGKKRKKEKEDKRKKGNHPSDGTSHFWEEAKQDQTKNALAISEGKGEKVKCAVNQMQAAAERAETTLEKMKKKKSGYEVEKRAAKTDERL